MKAIILAAGVGRRLGDGVVEVPKCLLRLGGRSLLDRMLDILEACGVHRSVVVVGHLGEQVERAVAERRGVRTLFNREYRKGAVVSLWTARRELDGDVLVMDADVLFPEGLLRRLVDSPEADCFLLDPDAEDDGEAQMLMVRGGRVVDIARGRRGEHDLAGESIGFLKLSAAGAAELRSLLERAVEAGRDGIEHEELYPELMRRRRIGYETSEGFPWIEIDFPEDVRRAEEMLASGELGP